MVIEGQPVYALVASATNAHVAGVDDHPPVEGERPTGANVVFDPGFDLLHHTDDPACPPSVDTSRAGQEAAVLRALRN